MRRWTLFDVHPARGIIRWRCVRDEASGDMQARLGRNARAYGFRWMDEWRFYRLPTADPSITLNSKDLDSIEQKGKCSGVAASHKDEQARSIGAIGHESRHAGFRGGLMQVYTGQRERR